MMGTDIEIYFNRKDLKKADWFDFNHCLELFELLWARRWFLMKDLIGQKEIKDSYTSKELLDLIKNREYSVRKLGIEYVNYLKEIKSLIENIHVKIILMSDYKADTYKSKYYTNGYNIIKEFQEGFKP
ncbi:MAG: hypothetical protein ACYCS1_04290 [Gammaproteobacteria bacterium]